MRPNLRLVKVTWRFRSSVMRWISIFLRPILPTAAHSYENYETCVCNWWNFGRCALKWDIYFLDLEVKKNVGIPTQALFDLVDMAEFVFRRLVHLGGTSNVSSKITKKSYSFKWLIYNSVFSRILVYSPFNHFADMYVIFSEFFLIFVKHLVMGFRFI